MAQDEVRLESDRPFLSEMLNGRVVLECCYSCNKDIPEMLWVKRTPAFNRTWLPIAVASSDGVTPKYNVQQSNEVKYCGTLTFESVKLNASGLYQCFLNSSTIRIFTHGTYLHVYSE